MSKKLVPILIMTLITLVAWVAFQVFNILSETTIPAPTQKQIEPLDPILDTGTLENLKNRIQ